MSNYYRNNKQQTSTTTAAAHCEQKYYASYRVRAAARRVKQERLQEVMRMAQLERWAATKLQCNWRAAVGRQECKVLKLTFPNVCIVGLCYNLVLL